MKVNIEKIKVEKRIREDYGNIKELAEDIEKNGLINPITVAPVNGRYQLVAGARRLKACKSLGIEEVEVKEVPLKCYEEALKVEISENELRKDFNLKERQRYMKKLIKIKKSTGANLHQAEEEAAKEIGIGSRRQYYKEKYVAENADPDLIDQLNKNQISTHAAYKQLKEDKEEAERKLKEEKQKNKNLKQKLEEKQSKEPEVVEKEVIPDDYKKMKKENRKMKKELQQKRDQLNQLSSRINKLEKNKKRLEEKADLNEEEAKEHKELKTKIKNLKEEKSSIHRQFEAVGSVADFTSDIEKFLQENLAPVKYSKALRIASDDEIVIKNVKDIIGEVRNWCDEVEDLLPDNTNYINAEVIDDE